MSCAINRAKFDDCRIKPNHIVRWVKISVAGVKIKPRFDGQRLNFSFHLTATFFNSNEAMKEKQVRNRRCEDYPVIFCDVPG